MVGLAGATTIAERVAGVTVSTVEPLTEPAVAAIVALASHHAVRQSSRCGGAIDGKEELQLTDVVRS